MKIFKAYALDIILAVLISVFITMVTAIVIYPLFTAICNIEDFDGY